MKKLLHVVNISFVIPYFLGEQLLYFNERNYKEHIVCSPSIELETLSKKYGFVYKGISILRKISLFSDLKALLRICCFIYVRKIDIVTGHTPKGALLAMVAAYIMRVPKRIYFRHGLVYETSTGLKRELLILMDKLAARLATKIVCVSPSVYKRSLEDGLNKETKQIVLLKGTCNGIDIRRFNKSNIRQEILLKLKSQLGIAEDSFVIGFTGRLARDKGIIELIDAFTILKEKYLNIQLLLVGMLEERDALPTNTVDKINENPDIITTGYVENATIENYYALMDVFVLPSYREGFPTSVLEASAMELPIITTKATGCIDSIIENKTGIFISHNALDIYSSMELLYNNKQMRIIYGNNGRTFVEENFRQELIWKEIERLYIE